MAQPPSPAVADCGRTGLPLSRCGKGRLFQGFLTLRPRCEACGLDFAFADSGDGPAVFVILFAGFVVVGLALVVEFLYQPPFWLHALLWGPLILAGHARAAAPVQGRAHRPAVSPRRGGRPARPEEVGDGGGGTSRDAVSSFRPSRPWLRSRFCISLGTWQLERKAWKEGLIATLEPSASPQPRDRSAGARVVGSPRSRATDEFRRVALRAELLPRPGGAGLHGRLGATQRYLGSRLLGVRAGAPRRRQPRGGQPRLRAGRARRTRSTRPDGQVAGRSRSSARCAGRKRAACSPRPTIRRAISGSSATTPPWRPPRAGDAVAPFFIDQEAPAAARRPAARRPGSRPTCPTTTCNMRSPGTAWHWCWSSCSSSGRAADDPSGDGPR